MKTKLMTFLMMVMMLIMVQGVLANHNSDLVIEGLKFNTISVAPDATTAGVKPMQDFTVDFTLKNRNTSNAVTGASTTFILSYNNGDPNSTITTPLTITKDQLNVLPNNAPLSVSISGKIPLTSQGNYQAVVVASGDNGQNELINADDYKFFVDIKQEDYDTIISNVTVSNSQGTVLTAPQQITCESGVLVDVELTNRAKNPEDNVDLKVTGGNGYSDDTTFKDQSLSSNTQQKPRFPIPAEKLNAGSNTFTVELKYRNYYTATKTFTVTKNACLTGGTPVETSLLIVDGTAKQFSVTTATSSVSPTWSVTKTDGTAVTPTGSTTGTSFSQTFAASGDYIVKAQVGGETKLWNVKVTDKPETNNFNTTPTLSAGVTMVTGLEIVAKNGAGKIKFEGQQVDLNNIASLDNVVVITGDKVAINSADAAGINKPATITLFKTFTKPLILKATVFNEEPIVPCVVTIVNGVPPECVVQPAPAGSFAFSVTGFSAYKVVEEVPAGFEITSGEILFDNVSRGQTTSTLTVTVKNKGTYQSLSGISAVLENVNSAYTSGATGLSASAWTTQTPFGAGQEKTLQLQFKVPSNEAGGKHSIGSLKLTGTKPDGTTDTKLVSIFVQPKSLLAVNTIKVDGSTSGDLLLDKPTKIAVTVENQHTIDLKDVQVTVKILNVGNDDLSQESESFDLNHGKDKTVTVEFDLSKETLNEDSYEVEITVEGEDTDHVNHETREVKSFNVKRENHHLILKTLTLGSTQLECSRDTTLEVTVENVGKNDENDVEVHVKNTALSLDQKQTGMKLDKFSGSDNEDRVNFALNLADASAGTYPLTVEVYRGGTLEESKEVTLTVAACGTSAGKTATGSSTGKISTEQVSQQLQQALVEALGGQQGTTGAATAAGTSFRDSTAYVVFLAVIGALLLTAVVLSLAVLGRKR